jgi:hypothetical protein
VRNCSVQRSRAPIIFRCSNQLKLLEATLHEWYSYSETLPISQNYTTLLGAFLSAITTYQAIRFQGLDGGIDIECLREDTLAWKKKLSNRKNKTKDKSISVVRVLHLYQHTGPEIDQSKKKLLIGKNEGKGIRWGAWNGSVQWNWTHCLKGASGMFVSWSYSLRAEAMHLLHQQNVTLLILLKSTWQVV